VRSAQFADSTPMPQALKPIRSEFRRPCVSAPRCSRSVVVRFPYGFRVSFGFFVLWIFRVDDGVFIAFRAPPPFAVLPACRVRNVTITVVVVVAFRNRAFAVVARHTITSLPVSRTISPTLL
jgi:hypothetical protein